MRNLVVSILISFIFLFNCHSTIAFDFAPEVGDVAPNFQLEGVNKNIKSINMSRVCELTGAKANNGMAVSHSHIRTKKLQQVNLQKRRLWWEEGKKWVNIKISTKALKSIQKVGLDKFAKANGVDLKKF